MQEMPRYDRAKLVNLLTERLAFERTAIHLYDAILEKIGEFGDPDLKGIVPKLRAYREQEEEHEHFLGGIIERLGGAPTRTEMTKAVERESRGIEQVIIGEHSALPVFHALLGAELMDNAGWSLLLELAREAGDQEAIPELEARVSHENDHLALMRDTLAQLARKQVLMGDGHAREQHETPQRGRESASAAKITTDPDEIRGWVEQRGGFPARVRRSGGGNDPGILRIDFPGFSGETTLERIDWDTWFDHFEKNQLAFLHQDQTADGHESRFCKLVSRDTVERRRHGEPHASVHHHR